MVKKKGERKMYTIRQAAEITGAAPSSIRAWLSNDQQRAQRFPGAVLQEPPEGVPGVPYWLIPADDLKNFEMGKPGPKPGSKRGKKDKPRVN
jgi:hypothetical protein